MPRMIARPITSMRAADYTSTGKSGWSIGAPAGSSSTSPANSGDVRHARGAWTMMQNELLRIRMETGKSIIFVTHSIPEAVYLSDRVVVMSPRPGRITDIVPIPLGGSRDEATRESEDFFHCVTAVREALRGPVGGAEARARVGEV